MENEDSQSYRKDDKKNDENDLPEQYTCLWIVGRIGVISEEGSAVSNFFSGVPGHFSFLDPIMTPNFMYNLIILLEIFQWFLHPRSLVPFTITPVIVTLNMCWLLLQVR